MAEVVVDLEKKTSRLTLKSFSNVKNLEKKIYYESQLGLSLKKRNRLFEIIEKDNSWSNRQKGLYFTNVHAHHTQWHLHKENVEFKELANIIENRLMYSVLKVPLKHTVKECWGSIYEKDDYAKPHHHHPYLWAFTYYPFAPMGSSPLRFHDTVVQNGKTVARFPDYVKEVFPSDDLLLLFPANTHHSVPKSLIDEKRVVIAGNMNIEHI